MRVTSISNTPLLEVKALSKRFGGVLAVDSADLRIEKGQIVGLIGSNGAGKTTLFNLITGFVPQSSGRVYLDGVDLTTRPIYERVRLGLARTFQAPQLFGEMSVRENVLSATYASQLAITRSAKARYRRASGVEDRCDKVLNLVGLLPVEQVMAAELPYGLQKKLEIGRALMTNPRILMLDEPAAGMLPKEADDLIRLVEDIRRMECAVLIVEHNMRVVMAISDVVNVMEFGRIIATGSPAEVRSSPEVIRAYLGEST